MWMKLGDISKLSKYFDFIGFSTISLNLPQFYIFGAVQGFLIVLSVESKRSLKFLKLNFMLGPSTLLAGCNRF